MCGIIGAIVRPGTQEQNDANEFIINQFEDQNSRGKEGFGIIRINNGKIEGIDRACTPMKFLMDLYTHKAESIIAHHRTPTSTDNKLAQTHPMFVSNKELEFDYLVIHNGVIQNDDLLKVEHEALGYKYTTEYFEESGYYTKAIRNKWNDSEGLAIDLARYIEKKQPELKVEGSAAFMAVQVEKGGNKVNKIFFGRRLNPINIKEGKGFIYLASEGPGELIESHKLFSVNLAKTEFKKTGEFIIRCKKLKFENERLDEEKKKAEHKAMITMNDKTIADSLKKQDSLPIPFVLTGKQDEKEEKEKKETEDYYKKQLGSEISEIKEAFDLKLQELEFDYWEVAKKGPERGTYNISIDMESAMDDRKLLISDILDGYTESVCDIGYDPDADKPRKQATLMMISKVLSTMAKIAEYESFNLEQAELEENGDDLTGYDSKEAPVKKQACGYQRNDQQYMENWERERAMGFD